MMILHYLGLDHIGHTVGPASPLVAPKLQEMDKIIQNIYTSLEKKGSDFLVLVCGDHGMSDQGSHGGASDREVLVPAVFLSPLYKNHKEMWRAQHQLLQVDLAPTLSVLLGLPPPSNSLGQLLVSVFDGFTDQQKLDSLYVNLQQVIRLMEQSVEDIEKESSYELAQYAIQQHDNYLTTGQPEPSHIFRSYEMALDRMTSRIAGSLTTYDHYAMLLAVIISFMALNLSLCLTTSSRVETKITVSVIGGICLSIILLFGHMTACTSQSFHSAVLCGWSIKSLALQMVLLASVIFLCFNILANFKQILTRLKMLSPKTSLERLLLYGTLFHSLSFGSSSFVEEEHQTWYFLTMTFYLVALVTEVKGHIINVVGKKTDILVEIAKYDDARNSVNSDEANVLNVSNSNGLFNKKTKTNCEQKVFDEQNHLSFEQTSMQKSPCEIKNHRKQIPFYQLLPWKLIVGIATVMLLGRLLRILNQTGNKWLDVPDVGDWLLSPENKSTLSVSVVGSLVIIFLCIILTGGVAMLESVFFTVGLVLVYLYRVNSGEILGVSELLNAHDNTKSHGIFEARLVYAVILLMNLISVYKNISHHYTNKHSTFEHHKEATRDQNSAATSKCQVPYSLTPIKTLHLSWILLMLLLLRTHNTMLVAMVTLQECLLWKDVIRRVGLSPGYLALLCWWMGQAVFFQQGNSNSLSTVDVSAGYVGLAGYQSTVVGVLLFCSTYAGPGFWLIALVKYHLELGQTQTTDKADTDTINHQYPSPTPRFALLTSVHSLLTERLVTLLFYCVVVSSQRYHLFVWTVFSPKLLYEGMLTLVFVVFALAVSAIGP
ncbi:GPI ethanolamine phosphate transferase 2-like isoform X2 [Mya arenaria]|nr:GPI ethanolamine phosphate transferase 2-like isoform X2 [Mya arenaria]